jgi:outer membrane lipoprotein carrier protein
MRRAALAWVAFLLPLAAGADPAADARAAERLESALDSLSGLRAEFTQTVTDAGGHRLESAVGTVSLARPGRFRWDYREPEQLIVSDGTTVWLYDVDLAQVTIRPAADSLAGTPALLLSGQADVAGAFEIMDGGSEGGLDWSRLRPREPDGDFTELRVGVAGGTLKRMLLLDKLGQTTELQFSGIERNPAFGPETFRFVPPPGVDVVGRADPGGG